LRYAAIVDSTRRSSEESFASPRVESTLSPGDVVDGRFRIDEHAGTGGMGTVFAATDLHARRRIALKVVGTGEERRNGSTSYQRFAREARILSRLEHPNIVRYLAHGKTAAGEPYLAMQWLEAEPLAVRVRHAPLAPAEASTLIRRIAEALAYAHARRVVHRDVKPSNVLLVDGDVAHPVLIDFGLARDEDAPRYTATGAAIGTPGYMSPEQARGQRTIDARSDVFSLGCLFYRVLAGRVPFPGDEPLEILARILFDQAPRVSKARSDVPASYDAVIGRMLAKEPDERPADATAVLQLLDETISARAEARSSLTGTSRQLSRDERSLVCMLVVASEASGPAAHEAATSSLSSEKAVREAVRAECVRLGARMETLADGSIVVLVPMEGIATDRAGAAARSALALRRTLAGSRIALALARVERGGDDGLGESVSDVVRLLHVPSDGEERPVRVDNGIAGLVRNRFDVQEDAGALSLRGEREPHERPVGVAGRNTPFVGRDFALASLVALGEASASRRTSLASLVLGEPGLGKSRLRDELVRALARLPRGPTVWSARAEAIAAPFALARALVEWAIGVRPSSAASTKHAALRAAVEERVAPARRPRVLAFLAELLGAPLDAADASFAGVAADEVVSLERAREDAARMADRTKSAWVELVAAFAAAHPLLILVDDAHHADAPTRRLLEAAVAACRELPLVVIAFARPDELSREWTLGEDAPLDLSPLTKEACETVARAVLEDSTDVARVALDCAGNPLLLEELLRARASGHAAPVGAALEAMLEARIQALDAVDRRVLRAASFFEGGVASSAVEGLVGAGAGDALERLVALELLVTNDVGELRFAHEPLRLAAQRGITAADRVVGHRLSAEWLATRGAPPVLLAHHLEGAGDLGRAAAAFVRAASDALDAVDLPAARSHATRALSLGADADVAAEAHLVMAEAARWHGSLGAARTAAETAATFVTTPSAVALGTRALRLVLASELGDASGLEPLAADLLKAANAARDPGDAHASALARGAISLFGVADDLAMTLTRAIARGAPPSSASAQGFVRTARALAASAAGDLGAYHEGIVGAVASFGSSRSTFAGAVALLELADALLALGRPEQAQHVCAAVHAEARALGFVVLAALARQTAAVALARLGRLDEARDAALDAIGTLCDSSPAQAATARASAARVLWYAGDLDAAERMAEVALANVPSKAWQAVASSIRAHARARAGQRGEAVRLAAEALDLLPANDAKLGGFVRQVCIGAFDMGGDASSAAGAKAAAATRLQALAATIRDDALRDSFVGGVPEHIAILHVSV
jgi:serine/threonine protein kinase/tetratricopeptide (TPR) repeat protein